MPQVVSQQRTLTPFTHDKGFFLAGLCRFALQVSHVALNITLSQLAASGGSALTSGTPTKRTPRPVASEPLSAVQYHCSCNAMLTKQFMHWHVVVSRDIVAPKASIGRGEVAAVC